MTTKKKIYSYALQDKIESQLSRDVLYALSMSGWNALGVYELVKQELANEKRALKKAANVKLTSGAAAESETKK